jgi:hypothetical protein
VTETTKDLHVIFIYQFVQSFGRIIEYWSLHPLSWSRWTQWVVMAACQWWRRFRWVGHFVSDSHKVMYDYTHCYVFTFKLLLWRFERHSCVIDLERTSLDLVYMD